MLRPTLPGLADEMIAAIARRGPRLRARHGRDVRPDGPARRRGRAQPLHGHGRRPGRGRHAGSRHLRQPRPRRVPRRPQPRRAARRLPRRRPAGLAALRRGGDRRRPGAGRPVLGRRGDLRLHRRDLRRVGRRLRRGAVRRRRARASAGGAGSCACSPRTRRPGRRRSAPPPRPPAGRSRASASRALGAGASADGRRSRREPVGGRRDGERRRRATRGEPVAGEEIVEAIADAPRATARQRRLGGAAGGLACVFVPDPDAPGRRRQIVAALDHEDGRDIVGVGPTVAWHDAIASLRRAAAAFRLAAAGRIPGGLVIAEEHLATLLLAADPALAADLAASRLAPLDALARRPARATHRDAARLARPPGPGPGRRGRARRAPADRPLPPAPAARAVRHAPGGSGSSLRAEPRPSGGIGRKSALRALFMWACASS